MGNSMKKPTGKSGDDMTVKCQALSRRLISPWYIFADDATISSVNINPNQCDVLQVDLDIINTCVPIGYYLLILRSVKFFILGTKSRYLINLSII